MPLRHMVSMAALCLGTYVSLGLGVADAVADTAETSAQTQPEAASVEELLTVRASLTDLISQLDEEIFLVEEELFLQPDDADLKLLRAEHQANHDKMTALLEELNAALSAAGVLPDDDTEQ